MIEEDGFNIWSRYSILEDSFIEFLKYVPYNEKHEHVTSPYLDDLLIRICTLFDSFLKSDLNSDYLTVEAQQPNNGLNASILEEKRKKDNTNITDYRKLYDPYYKLSSKRVYFIYPIFDTSIIPLFNWKDQRFPYEEKTGLKWWLAYNQLKHDKFSDSDYKADLSNVRDALGALFLTIVYNKNMYRYLISNGIISGGAAPGFLYQLMMEKYPNSSTGYSFSQGIVARSKCFGNIFEIIYPDEYRIAKFAKTIFSPPYKEYDEISP